jgi:hypothetical protein
VVYLRLVHPFEELAGVGGKGFYVSALAFSIKGIKDQAALARTRYARDHHQFFQWYLYIYVLEVVNPYALGDNTVLIFGS